MRIVRTLLAIVTIAIPANLAPVSVTAHEVVRRPDAGPQLPPCTCRANGQDFQMGEVACLRTSQGARLARCVMVLNNSSWETIQQSCPSADRAFTPRPSG
ncbi:hypothetical protein [uncultured Alsobacter sp.]|uniref:hypothetical protein n=1 Tax=uncultured Alsobacter sp. TaxID=1748258 RepID=UPI0025DFC9AD|nr:hypothetical protein [uncultured Alsobacter sp.]